MRIIQRIPSPQPHQPFLPRHHNIIRCSSILRTIYQSSCIKNWKQSWTTTSFILSSCCYYICGRSSSTNSFLLVARAAAMMSSTSSVATTTASNTALSMIKPNVIDSHLHVWGTHDDSESKRFPYAQTPPTTLQDSATVSRLLQCMEKANIDGALIVQPINYLYDHSYVLNAIKEYPTKLKGMMLYNPTELDEHRAIQRLEELVLSGFVGVRFNPYLFPKSQEPVPQSTTNNDAIVASRSEWGPMSEGTSLQVYQRCASLHIPVGIMCFQGLQYHYHDIQQLLESSPQTIMILDHFAFTQLDDDTVDASSPNQNTFVQLLQLATFPSVHVKISALFRMNDNRSSSSSTGPYERVYRERFVPLLQAYGPQRLLYGSDFPYVLESESRQNDTDHAYTNTCQLVASWCPDVESRNAIMGGNAERLFGPWGTLVPATR